MMMSWSEVKLRFGKLLNLAGFPGLVRECDYHSRALNASVKVRKYGLYTIVTVNGLEIYFTRFTGKMDGVGFNPTSDCKVGALPDTPESMHLDAQHAPPSLPEPARSKTRYGQQVRCTAAQRSLDPNAE
jgi:hypothetical protein